MQIAEAFFFKDFQFFLLCNGKTVKNRQPLATDPLSQDRIASGWY